MWKRHLSFIISFGLVALFVLFAETWHISQLQLLLKPLICILLSGYLISCSRLYGTFSKLIFLGLLFSLAGDILSIFAASKVLLFLAGLSAFFIAQLFYSIAFIRDYLYDVRASNKIGYVILFIIALYSVVLILLIQPFLAELSFWLGIYVLAVSITVVLAAFRHGRVNRTSFRLILTGMFSFLISTGFLALNRLVAPFSSSGVFIMATYMLAQILITFGTIERSVGVRNEILRKSGY
ncbi:MAG: lysoplasmalogenase [Flavobacterium sp.]|nr:lysoplasmalogenase [Pedobacter sp.]